MFVLFLFFVIHMAWVRGGAPVCAVMKKHALAGGGSLLGLGIVWSQAMCAKVGVLCVSRFLVDCFRVNTSACCMYCILCAVFSRSVVPLGCSNVHAVSYYTTSSF